MTEPTHLSAEEREIRKLELAALRDNPAALRMRLAYLEAERSREVLAAPPEDGKTDSTVAQEKVAWCSVCDRSKSDCACVENGGTY